jgi:phage/plasmid-like protein (TIGR03299 family)
MAHELDMSNARANMAYVNAVPWHGLGQRLTEDADIDTWQREAGLNFTAVKAPVRFNVNGDQRVMNGRHVLYRDDTGEALGIVSNDYREVQPKDVMDFFRDITTAGGFQMETAGSLYGGRKIWALARVSDGAPIVGDDVVRPYLMMATSFDGSLATTCKFTAVRVVCNNTISIALNRAGETDENRVRVVHHRAFDAEQVRAQLGIYTNAWERFMIDMRRLADRKMNGEAADDFLIQLFRKEAEATADVRDGKAYRAIMALFDQSATIGDDRSKSAWNMLNAVTEFVDHSAGRLQDRRLESAWFGAGDAVKTKARDILLAA